MEQPLRVVGAAGMCVGGRNIGVGIGSGGGGCDAGNGVTGGAGISTA